MDTKEKEKKIMEIYKLTGKLQLEIEKNLSTIVKENLDEKVKHMVLEMCSLCLNL